ncbi:MAG: LEA type 2 family protein [Bacteroidia bacterium]
MLRKKYFFSAIFLLSLFLFSSCNDFQPVIITGIDSVTILQANKDGISAEIGVRIKNPNTTSFTVYSSDLNVQLNDMQLGTAHLSEKVTIPANAEDTRVFKVKTDFSKISLTDLLSLLPMLGGGNNTVVLKGEIKAGKFFYRKTFPVDVSKPINGQILFNH